MPKRGGDDRFRKVGGRAYVPVVRQERLERENGIRNGFVTLDDADRIACEKSVLVPREGGGGWLFFKEREAARTVSRCYRKAKPSYLPFKNNDLATHGEGEEALYELPVSSPYLEHAHNGMEFPPDRIAREKVTHCCRLTVAENLLKVAMARLPVENGQVPTRLPQPLPKPVVDARREGAELIARHGVLVRVSRDGKHVSGASVFFTDSAVCDEVRGKLTRSGDVIGGGDAAPDERGGKPLFELKLHLQFAKELMDDNRFPLLRLANGGKPVKPGWKTDEARHAFARIDKADPAHESAAETAFVQRLQEQLAKTHQERGIL